MTISKERRDAIRAAAEKATPGPWEVGPVDDTVVTHLGADGLRCEVASIDGDYNSPDEWPTMEANAAHIANCDPQTIIALLGALAAQAAEIERLRGLLWYAWHEFNAIRARSGAPLDHYGMTTCSEEWWDRMTDEFKAAIGPDAATPWPSEEAKAAILPKPNNGPTP